MDGPSSLGKNYSVVETDEFHAKIRQLVGRDWIWDDAKTAFDQLLSRDPEAVGTPVAGTGWRLIAIHSDDGLVWIAFRVEHAEKAVILVDGYRG